MVVETVLIVIKLALAMLNLAVFSALIFESTFSRYLIDPRLFGKPLLWANAIAHLLCMLWLYLYHPIPAVAAGLSLISAGFMFYNQEKSAMHHKLFAPQKAVWLPRVLVVLALSVIVLQFL